MRWLPRVFPLFLLVPLAACGGDDGGTSDGDRGSERSAGTPAASGTGAAGAGAASGAGGGSARVTAGTESFAFEIECQFGTGIIRGPGTNDEGKVAFVQMSMPVDDRGKPKNDPSSVEVSVWVGKNRLTGPSLYEYHVAAPTGSVSSYSDDGKRAEGEVQFEYRDKEGSKEGLAYGDEVGGSFAATCP